VADHLFQQSITLIIVVASVAAIVCAAAAWSITRGLQRQLGGEPAYAAAVSRSIAQGELAVDVAVRHGDNASLMLAIRTMRDNLAGIVGRVREGTDAIVTASSEIAHGNADLAQRTEQQAGAIEEVATTLEELTATVRENAGNAQRANVLAQSASDVSQRKTTRLTPCLQEIRLTNGHQNHLLALKAITSYIELPNRPHSGQKRPATTGMAKTDLVGPNAWNWYEGM
jgi:methyl-accepting chemotaxis protein